MKRIAIVGPIPRDHIITHQGDLIQKWGCVTHPVMALSVMAGDSIEIIPVSHVRNVDKDNVKEVFKGMKGINLNHVTSKNDQGDIISLRFIDMNNRLERQTGFMDPIVQTARLRSICIYPDQRLRNLHRVTPIFKKEKQRRGDL
jgi:hypothetical protein